VRNTELSGLKAVTAFYFLMQGAEISPACGKLLEE